MLVHRTGYSPYRLLGSVMLIAMAVFGSPSAAEARRAPSPYAFEDPLTPGTDLPDTDVAKVTETRSDPPTSNVVSTAGPAAPTGGLPAVAPMEVPAGDAVADPKVDAQPVSTGSLANTGMQGLTSRIAFAMMLVAAGLLIAEAGASRHKRAWAR